VRARGCRGLLRALGVWSVTRLRPRAMALYRCRSLLLLRLLHGARHFALAATDLELVRGWPEQTLGSGAKRLTLIRHAEALHNRDAREIPNYFADGLGYTQAYWDASLTPHGEDQARLLAGKLQWRQEKGSPQLVVVSPMTRTLQTASLAFLDIPNPASGRAPLRRPPFVATSLARERMGNHTCDGRRERAALAADFPHVDFSEVADGPDDMWDHKEMEPDDMDSTACAARAERLLRWLWERPESEIAVVSHWVFLSHLLRPHALPAEFVKIGNAEMRFVTLQLRNAATPPKEEL